MTSAARPVADGNADPIAILISSAAFSPIATPQVDRRCSWIAASRSDPPNGTPSHGDDVAVVTTDQVPSRLTDRDHGAGGRVERDDRGLVEDDPLPQPVHDRVRRSKVDREVPPHQAPITQWPSPVARSSFFQMGTSC